MKPKSIASVDRTLLALRSRALSPVLSVVGAFALYLSLSLLLFGRRVIADPTQRVVGDSSADKTLYMWSFEWWPWAIGHGRNPLDVGVAWAPRVRLRPRHCRRRACARSCTTDEHRRCGRNLQRPHLARARHRCDNRLRARTLRNKQRGAVARRGIPVRILVVRTRPLLRPSAPRIHRARPPRALPRHAETGGQPFTAGIRRAPRRCPRRPLLIVTQIFFSLVLVSAAAAAIASAVLGWPKIRRTLAEATLALMLTLIVVSPILVYAIVSDAAAPARSPFAGSADLLNYLIPTRRTWLRPPGADEITTRFTGSGAEQGAYLSLPLVLLAVLAVVKRPISRPRLLLGLVLVAVVILSLGTRVKVAGEVLVPAPWTALSPLPIVGSALPARLTMYAALFRRASSSRWRLQSVEVSHAGSLPPSRWSPRSRTCRKHSGRQTYRDPSSSGRRLTTSCPRDQPHSFSPMAPPVGQCSGRRRRDSVSGSLAATSGLGRPRRRSWRDVYEALGTGQLLPSRLRAFLVAHDVDAVILAPGTGERVRRVVTAAVDSPPRNVYDTVIIA